MLNAEICTRALGARDARFDGLFFVGITSTRVYCRPVCPARVSDPDHRRFFESPAAAESAGFRPCLRCRPELAPGRAVVDAVPRLASIAARRIAAGALNERSVRQLARELGVSERHLRRALEREVGVSPLELAQTHRLLLAKRLLVDTPLSVTRVAYASGFRSLRRFNSVFRERYRMSPSDLRRRHDRDAGPASYHDEADTPLELTLTYREPLAWNALLGVLRRSAMPQVELVDATGYRRIVRLGRCTGVIFVREAGSRRTARSVPSLTIDLSPALVPAVMPLLARVRHLFDLDAEPAVIDGHLSQGGLGTLVSTLPGLRVPGAFDGFEVAVALLVRRACKPSLATDVLRRVAETLGDPVDTGNALLTHTAPTAERIAQAAPAELIALGIPRGAAQTIGQVARMIVNGSLRLEPGGHVDATQRALLEVDGITGTIATAIVARALQWPDAFAPSDRVLRRVMGASSIRDVVARAEQWRPWRAYAAMHLLLRAERAERAERMAHA